MVGVCLCTSALNFCLLFMSVLKCTLALVGVLFCTGVKTDAEDHSLCGDLDCTDPVCGDLSFDA